MKGFPDLPPIWLLGFCVLAWVIGRTVPVVDVSGPFLRWLGTALCLLGLGLIFWSAMWFLRKKTTIEPHEVPTVLIVEGPYRLSRNPIYLAMVAILSGVVLWQGTLLGVLLPPIFAAIVSRRFIQPEEVLLMQQFGGAAESYLTATRRWL